MRAPVLTRFLLAIPMSQACFDKLILELLKPSHKEISPNYVGPYSRSEKNQVLDDRIVITGCKIVPCQ